MICSFDARRGFAISLERDFKHMQSMNACVDLRDLAAPVEADFCAVEEYISEIVQAPVLIVRDATMHTLGAGGKRIRPLLTLLSAKAVGEINSKVIAMAALVEIAHTAALIHDDVIDEAETRRGRPAANGIWGNQATVLVGDYLISQIVFILSDDEFRPFQRLIALAARRMCVGQLLEIELRRKVGISEDEYKELIRCKTSELISTACEVGAIAADGIDTQVRGLAEYGTQTGMAFQIVDDVLDVTSHCDKLGKPVGNDLREGKITLPYIRTLAVADSVDRARLAHLLSTEDPSEGVIKEAIAILHRYDGIDYSLAAARGYVEAAQDALEAIPQSPIKSILCAVAEFVLLRQS